MTITILAVAKGVAISTAIVGSTVAAAHFGTIPGITIALQHVPTWTHAHTVISGFRQKG